MLRSTSCGLRTVNYKLSLRPISTTNLNTNKNQSSQSTLQNFTPIYKFPYIRAVSIVNRLKFYHTAFTAVAIPSSLILNEFNVIQPEAIMITAIVGVTGCMSLFTLGILTNKVIGFVYLNKEENLVRIAYVDFWGRRRNEDVPLKDVVPFSEVPASPMDGLYLKFSRFSAQSTLKINVNLGQILDKEKFIKVFASE